MSISEGVASRLKLHEIIHVTMLNLAHNMLSNILMLDNAPNTYFHVLDWRKIMPVLMFRLP